MRVQKEGTRREDDGWDHLRVVVAPLRHRRREVGGRDCLRDEVGGRDHKRAMVGRRVQLGESERLTVLRVGGKVDKHNWFALRCSMVHQTREVGQTARRVGWPEE